MNEIKNFGELWKAIEKMRDSACDIMCFADDGTVQDYLKGVIDLANWILTKKDWCRGRRGG